jgi:hypothetical protein
MRGMRLAFLARTTCDALCSFIVNAGSLGQPNDLAIGYNVARQVARMSDVTFAYRPDPQRGIQSIGVFDLVMIGV